MGNYLFVLTRGIEDPTRVTRTLQLAQAAKELGHEVSLFLTDDAVWIAKTGIIDNVVAPTGDEAVSHFTYLLENNVPVYLCIPCAESRQVTQKDVDPAIQFAGSPKIFELAENATVFTF